MKTTGNVIQLNSNPQPTERLVKRAARFAFSTLRILASKASTVPGTLSQAASDVREAWQETARPNV